MSIIHTTTQRGVIIPMNQSDLNRNAYMLQGSLAKRGYIRWWHSFRGTSPETGDTRTFFVEYFVINPSLGGEQPILGQHPYYKKRGRKPSYACMKVGVFPNGEGADGRQLHAYYPISAMKVAQNPLFIQMEDCI